MIVSADSVQLQGQCLSSINFHFPSRILFLRTSRCSGEDDDFAGGHVDVYWLLIQEAMFVAPENFG